MRSHPIVDYKRFFDRATVTAPAVVLGPFDWPTSIGVTRDLGRLGVPSLMLDYGRAGYRAPSRYAARRLCPHPYHDPDGLVRALEDLGSGLPQKGVLVPTNDDYLLPVANAAERLSRFYLMPFSVHSRMARVNDKWEQLEAAARAGVDGPRTALIRSEEDLEDAARHVPFPAVLKPSTPLAAQRHLGVKLLKLERAERLPAAFRQARVCGPLLLQEYIPGADADTCYLGSYLDAESRPLAIFTGRRLRQYPTGSGLTTIAESVWMPEVADEGVRLLQEMDFHGVSHVEFKRDPRDGRFKLMEINARLYGTHSLAAACGVNLSAAAYYDAIGRPFHAPLQREGVRWLAMNRDLVASPRQILHGDLSIGEWVATLRGVRVDGALSLDDPLPGVAVLLATANRVLRRSVQVVRRRSL
jgi:predicted ATP-grasp superfamily ATP-dependent carboligase